MPVNRLAQETSPYLRQHQDNPVDWYPWGPEAFAEAARRDVPILLSVGYSACHWCHVMAHESFEDQTVADVMNADFVNVKVDREERPDVDSVYMDAVQALTRRGGWPMTVFLTPTGEPFHGGTYFPKPMFLSLLAAVTDAWRNRRADLATNAQALTQAVGRTAQLQPAAAGPGPAEIVRTVDQFRQAADRTWGGFGQAPKFPSTMSLELLTAYAVTTTPVDDADQRRVTEARAIVGLSLDMMAAGGMHDHVGGGFARYSVDERWLVPHFEKMLYDQALLLRVSARAAASFGPRRWHRVAARIVEYLRRDLRQPGGAFASAEDADSPGPDGHNHEGLFSTWTPAEIEAALGQGAQAWSQYYGITSGGNFEGRSIPNRLHDPDRHDTPVPPEIEAATDTLLAVRAKRPRPGLDDKVLTEWNALAIAALAEAGQLLDEPGWITTAEEAAEFLVAELRTSDGRWHRSWQADGTPPARHMALAADHAALVDAFTRLGEATGRSVWTERAVEVADTLLDWFWDPHHGGLFTTAHDAEDLIVRQKDLLDNATPSANSTAATALIRLAAITGEMRYQHHADRILALMGPIVDQAGTACAQLLQAAGLRARGVTEVVIAGDRPDLLAAYRATWRPDTVLLHGERTDSIVWDGKQDGLAYVCEHGACQAPQSTPEGLLAQL